MFRCLSSIATAATSIARSSLLCALVLCLFAARAFPADVTLAWDGTAQAELAGYRLYWGDASGNYTQNRDVGKVTQYTLTGLEDGHEYYFAATAYDTSKTIESAFSNEVRHTTPAALSVDFTATPTSGEAPVVVTFHGSSNGSVNSWSWDFGDGTTGTGETAVTTYANPGVYTVRLSATGPTGSAERTKTDLLTVTAPPPVADFSAAPTSGPAPLTVNFADVSNGNISQWFWDFGDGQSSSARNPSHTYTAPGTYTVELTVTGPGGTNTKTLAGYVTVSKNSDPTPNTSPVLEVGEIGVDDHWYRVSFGRSFVEPVVIAKPLSSNGSDPASVRIRNVDTEGFDIRVQEWDYRDGRHALEAISYLVMEHGTYTLADGTRLEARRFESSATNFQTITFGQAFQQKPVVLSSVNSFNGSQAVTTRLQNITTTGMQFRMQEEEANDQSHAREVIGYLAWEPSAGTVDGLRFEVNRTADVVDHNLYTIPFPTTFNDIPMFLADLQTHDGADTANLRWRNMDLDGVDVYVAEEQSKDSETAHTTESVGYLLLSPQ